jgi:UDP-glucose 4-epimerase
MSINDVADEITNVMGLGKVEYVYMPVALGVGWKGDIKQILLDIGKLKSIGWRPTMNSRRSVIKAAESLLKELTTL